jgi:DNA-binding transcriptional regulator YiaG
MTIRYHLWRGRLNPQYVCQAKRVETGAPICQSIPGQDIDKAIGELLLELVAPLTLEIALAVQEELRSRIDEADQLRKKQVERAQYEADLAQERYMQVDPKNRLVADSLEAEWNDKLRALTEAQQQYEQQSLADRTILDEKAKSRVSALATGFPKIWCDPETPDRERKRMVRLLIEDVTLIKRDRITVQVCLKGGATRTLKIPIPLNSWQEKLTDPEIVHEIDRLLDFYTYSQIASILNQKDLRSGEGKPFTRRIISRIRRDYKLKTRYERLREKGMLSLKEMAASLGVCTKTISEWGKHGIIRSYTYNDKNERLCEPPGEDRPRKSQGQKLSKRTRYPELLPHRSEEVHHGA